MFEKFQTAVRNAYLDLKNNGQLHFDRAWPSPGELRSWCLKCYLRGLTQDDKIVFTNFFNKEESTKDLPIIIENFDLDKLRPLRNFISGDTQKRPDENLVKLLAVLIDFKPRPYKAAHWDNRLYTGNLYEDASDLGTTNPTSDHLAADKSFSLVDDEKEIPIPATIEHELFESREKKKDTVKHDGIKRKPRIKTLIYVWSGLAIVTLLGIVIYLSTPVDCMCWNGEHYVEVDCQDKAQPYQIVGLDKNKLVYFQKITRPDTLNHEDVGKVWYSKINNEVEFFTYPGHHPVQYGKSLKATTRHIIDRYAGKNAKKE